MANMGDPMPPFLRRSRCTIDPSLPPMAKQFIEHLLPFLSQAAIDAGGARQAGAGKNGLSGGKYAQHFQTRHGFE